jgi:hypothetical protein
MEGLALGRGPVCDAYAIIPGFTRNLCIRITGQSQSLYLIRRHI